MTIGTELLLGQTLDSNGAVLGRALAEIGVRVTRRTTVADDPAAIAATVGEALARTGAVLTTGGLGPTSDDVTKQTIAAHFQAPLHFEDTVWQQICERFRLLGRDPVPANRGQAEVPLGATVLPNPWGTAPGLWLEGAPGLAIMLPGVPGEMVRLLQAEVLPRLTRRSGTGAPIRSLTVRTTSIAESALGERIRPLEAALRPLSVAYIPSLDGVDVRLTSWRLPSREADALLEAAARRVETELSGFAYARDDGDLAAVVLEGMAAERRVLAVAESCTGGLVAARLTAVPGSSRAFLGGLVCYGDRQKTELAGVAASLIAQHGAVSEPVAAALAEGVRARTGADAAVGVTGVAGPAGGTEQTPVGTVWLAWSVGDRARTRLVRLPGTRGEVRARAAQLALHGLLQLMDRGARP